MILQTLETFARKGIAAMPEATPPAVTLIFMAMEASSKTTEVDTKGNTCILVWLFFF